MKKFRKIMAILVAALMIAATMVPAWAATEAETEENTITIRVNPNKKNQAGTGYLPDQDTTNKETYDAFRIFETTKSDATKGDTQGTFANHTNDPIDDEYVLLSDLGASAPSYSATTNYYKKSATAPYEYTLLVNGTDITAENYDSMKPTTYIEKGVNGADKGVAYYLKKTSKFAFLQAQSDVTNYLKFEESADGLGYVVTWKNSDAYSEANARKLAKIIDSYIFKKEDGYYAGANSASSVKLTVDTDYYAGISEETPKTDAKIGYYLIKSSLGSNLILATTDIDLTDKNTYPTVDKKIIAATLDTTFSTTEEQTETDAQIGDTIKFRLKAEIPDEANKKFELHDTMYKGLSLKVDSFVVKYKVGDADAVTLTQNENDKDNYLVHYSNKAADISTTGTAPAYVTAVTGGASNEPLKANESFVVIVTKDCIDKYVADRATSAINENAKDVTFIVEYEAVLNYQARLTTSDAPKYNENKVNLVYSNYKTPDVPVKVYAHELDIVKYYDDSDLIPLPGAKFQLYRDNGTNVVRGILQAGASPISFEKSGNVYTVQDGISTTYYGTVADANKTNVLESSDGKYTIKGLDEGTYYLMETYAPNGYNMLQFMTQIVVSRDGEATKVKSNIANDATKGTEDVGGVETPNITYNLPDNASAAAATIAEGKYTGGGVGIQNTPGTELPSTGGMGTTVLYIVGGMLVILAGAYLFFSRKRTA